MLSVPWEEAPRHLLRDRDGAFRPRVHPARRAIGIRDHPVAARSPWQNGYVERLIGSTRSECVDHVVIFGEAHMRRILEAYAAYYNEVRTYLSPRKDAPEFPASSIGRFDRSPATSGRIASSICSRFRF